MNNKRGGYIVNPTESQARSGYAVKDAKGGEVEKCKGPMCPGCETCMADGGEVMHHSPAGGSKNRSKGASRYRSEAGQEGVHKSKSIYTPGESGMGYSVRMGDYEGAKKVTYDKIREQRNSSERAKHADYADGGEVDPMPDMDQDSADDDAMMDMVADELLSAFEKKDKKEMIEAIRAIVLSCK